MKRTMRIPVAVGLSAGMLMLGAPAADATANGGARGCQLGVGVERTTFTSPTTSSGQITGSPLVAGQTSFVITSADATGHYTGVLSISTRNGTLTTDDSGVLRSDGSFTEVGQVVGSASTGRLSGAIGGIAIDGRQDPNSPGSFTAYVAAAVCLR